MIISDSFDHLFDENGQDPENIYHDKIPFLSL
jgi:hypothetical protein